MYQDGIKSVNFSPIKTISYLIFANISLISYLSLHYIFISYLICELPNQMQNVFSHRKYTRKAKSKITETLKTDFSLDLRAISVVP